MNWFSKRGIRFGVYITLMFFINILAAAAWKLWKIEVLTKREKQLEGPLFELQQKLMHHGYFAGNLLTTEVYLLLKAFERAKEALETMVLQGLPGTGKSSLARAIFSILSEKEAAAFLSVQVTSEMTGDQLLTADLPFKLILSEQFVVPSEFEPDAKQEPELTKQQRLEKYRSHLHQKGILRAAAELSRLRVKVVLVIDEMDKAPTANRGGSSIQQGPNAIEEALLDILQTGKLPGLGEKQERTLDARYVLPFVCMNFNQRLSPEFIRRARVIKVGFLPVKIEVELLEKAGVPKVLAQFMVERVADPIRSAASYLTYRAPEENELSIVPPLDVILRLARDLMVLVETEMPDELLRTFAEQVTVPELVASDAEKVHLYTVVPRVVFSKYLFELLLELKKQSQVKN